MIPLLCLLFIEISQHNARTDERSHLKNFGCMNSLIYHLEKT